MRTIKVETTGDFMLLDPFSFNEISAWGVSEVEDTDWVRARIKDGKLKLEGKPAEVATKTDEPVRAKAEQETVRGASKKQSVNTVKSA